MFKKSFFWVIPCLVFYFYACQSGNTLPIEKDEHPEIPFFPKLSGDKLFLKPINVQSLNLDSNQQSTEYFTSYDNNFINAKDSTFNTYKSIVVANKKSSIYKDGSPQGYVLYPSYLHYYNISFRGILASTKIDYTQQLCPKIVRIKQFVYFLYQKKNSKTLQAFELIVNSNNG